MKLVWNGVQKRGGLLKAQNYVAEIEDSGVRIALFVLKVRIFL